VTDTDAYIQKMAVTDPLMEPTVYAAIQALQLPSGSHGLDAGCGIGLQALLLAGAVGPTGRVTGLDISPGFLLHAEEIVKKSGLSDRISFKEGDVRELPFDDHTFDWAWNSSCVGYAAFLEPQPALQELARVVKPGGSVAIFAWSSEKFLPGYPLLEARLNATASGIAPFLKGKKPERHFLRALGWFRHAGLEEPTVRTFVGDAFSPLSDALRDALIALFEMRWPGVESELTQEDRAEYRRLCLPESPEFILNHPDYYAFFTCSMFCGKVAK
jgi:demethylmenaquinone methyltransferase/2-methoxy-6-polyprenyl-1,4-benzoquinol methylase